MKPPIASISARPLGRAALGRLVEAAKAHGIEILPVSYRVLLGREPDGAGPASYVSQPEAGKMGRTDVRRSIVGSDELRSRHAPLFAIAGMAPAGSVALD